jgi:hypothetical protein
LEKHIEGSKHEKLETQNLETQKLETRKLETPEPSFGANIKSQT